MKNLRLSFTQVFPKGAILAETRNKCEYLNGKRTDKILGLTYVLVNRSGYDKINVFVESMIPLITNEEIEASDNDILVTANGFEGTVYNRDGVIAISGRAEKVVLV